MKITIETTQHDVFTSEQDAVTLDEVIDQFKRLLVSAGFHPENVDQHFDSTDQWFPEVDHATTSRALETAHEIANQTL
jgi:Tat protein secretion system quality control protein TatD with DNase activity